MCKTTFLRKYTKLMNSRMISQTIWKHNYWSGFQTFLDFKCLVLFDLPCIWLFARLAIALWCRCSHRSCCSTNSATLAWDDTTAASVKVCSKYLSCNAYNLWDGFASASFNSDIAEWSRAKLAISCCKLTFWSSHDVTASSTDVIATTRQVRFSNHAPRISATRTDNIEKVISVWMSRLSWAASTFLFLPPWNVKKQIVQISANWGTDSIFKSVT